MTDQPNPLEKLDSASSLFEKTDPDLRHRLDRAIVDRDPPTYRAVYEKFALAQRQVSFIAFYRYARRLRLHAAALDFVRSAQPDAPDPADLVPAYLAQRLFDAAQDESTSPRTLQRLAEAWRVAIVARLTLRKHDAELEHSQKPEARKDTDELLDAVRAYGQFVREEQRLHLAGVRNSPELTRESPKPRRPPQDASRNAEPSTK